MDNNRFISHRFIRTHTVEAVRVLEKHSAREISEFLENMPSALAADVIRLMNPITAGECLDMMSPKICAAIIEQLPLEIESVLLRRLKNKVPQDILPLMSPPRADSLNLVLQYPQGTAGALMDPQVFTLPDDIMISDALKRIQKNPQHVINYLYVLNREHRLVGYVTIRRLMLASAGDNISAIMQRTDFTLSPEMSHRSILLNEGWNQLHALPVIDANGIFLGAIGYKTLRYLEKETEKKIATTKYDAGVALGELYWIGLSSFLKGAASFVEKEQNSGE